MVFDSEEKVKFYEISRDGEIVPTRELNAPEIPDIPFRLKYLFVK